MSHFYLPTDAPNAELGRLVWEIEIEYPIRLYRKRSRFAVQYGKEAHDNLIYVDAAARLGEAMFHALSLAGKMSNR